MNQHSVLSIIEKNLREVQARISAACERAGRKPNDVKLVAVTKYAHVDWVRALIDLGVSELGESRPQQLVERAELIDSDLRWHLIGSLQRNKIRKVLPVVKLIHSIDSLRLLEGIGRVAGELGVTASVLLEVNLSGEESKHGFDVTEITEKWLQIQRVRDVEIGGLMTMASRAEQPESARSVFRRLRELRDTLSDEHVSLCELSMGMSGDFEVAIEEGATLVRIGSSLYEGLS